MAKSNPNSSDLPQDQREFGNRKIHLIDEDLLSSRSSYLTLQSGTHGFQELCGDVIATVEAISKGKRRMSGLYIKVAVEDF